MKLLNPERVRAALALGRQARAMTDPDALIIAARDLRAIGRPDRALETLERARCHRNGSSAWRLERSCTLAALGRPEEAVREIRELLDAHPQAPAILRLIANFASLPGVAAVDKPNVRTLLSDTVAGDDPVSVLNKVPLKAVGRIPIGKVLAASAGQSAAKRLRLLFGVMRLKAIYCILDLAADLLLAMARLWAPTRDVRIASLGNFTRLADIVDRIDPVLRRLRSESEGRRKPLLMAIYYSGYPNETLRRLYAEHCRLVPLTGRLSRRLGKAAFSVIQRVGRHTELTTDYRKIKEDFLHHPPVLRIPDDVARNAERKLERLGVDLGKPIICFGLRDMAYYQFYGTVAKNDPSAGSREDTRHRCPPLGPYVQAAHYWAERGYQVLRMGLRVSEPLPDNRHPLVIDYAREGRSDELDAYLFSRCHFLLAGDTGLFSGAAAFDRPSVVTDLFLVRNTIYSSNKKTPNIFVPKLVLDREEGRYLSFREWVYFNHHFSFASDCERARFELVHNDSDDLIEATIELSERLDGRHEETDEDLDMQRRFRDIYAPYLVGHGSTGLVSSRFLRKHSDLLD